MAQQLVDGGAGMRQGAADGDAAERREPPGPVVIPGWRFLNEAVIRAHGEEGPVDVVALHPDRGVALIGFLAEGQEASPEDAREALRAMLRDEGFEARFVGELPIVALPLPHSLRPHLAAVVDRAFVRMPPPTVAPEWVDWVAERLRPAPPAVADRMPALMAPPRDEPLAREPHPDIALIVPQRGESAQETAPPGSELTAPAREPAGSAPERPRAWHDWGAVLGFAFGIAAAVAAGLAAVLRDGRMF